MALVGTLMACAEAVQQENLKLAEALLKRVGLLADSQAGAMRKVATCFAKALARRIYKIHPQDSLDATSYNDVLQMHFYETCPYLKFAHFTANQAILEAFGTASRVHVIDFSLKQGMQWPSLMQALALRPGGPPKFRLTGIGPPQPDNTDPLQQVGWKLAQLAETIGIEFEFRGFVATSLADLEPAMLYLRPPEVEAVAVNSVFELHRLLARPGAIEKVLGSIKAMKPKIVTIVEQEANHNGPVFLDRFTEALHYYSSLFDSLEGSGLNPASQDLVMSEVYLGRQICNVVACEGPDRFERHETLAQWQSRLGSSGFDPVHLGSNAFKQANMLLALFAGGDGYRVEAYNGCLMLGWHTRPLIATSAWQLAPTVTRKSHTHKHALSLFSSALRSAMPHHHHHHHHESSMEHLLGLLKVNVHRGVNLAVRDVRSSDPYVILKMGSQKLKTRVVKKNTNPEWNEELTLSVADPNIPIKVLVYDKDTFTLDDKMGDAEFHIGPFLEAQKMRLGGSVPDGTVISRIKPSRENCYSEESHIVWKDGRAVQNMMLRLQNVERGEVELEIHWVDVPGSRGLAL